MSKALNEEEELYVQKAIAANVQSTEILNVLVIRKCVTYCLEQLVGAMEEEDFKVFNLTPDQVQGFYTEMKVGIRQTVIGYTGGIIEN